MTNPLEHVHRQRTSLLYGERATYNPINTSISVNALKDLLTQRKNESTHNLTPRDKLASFVHLDSEKNETNILHYNSYPSNKMKPIGVHSSKSSEITPMDHRYFNNSLSPASLPKKVKEFYGDMPAACHPKQNLHSLTPQSETCGTDVCRNVFPSVSNPIIIPFADSQRPLSSSCYQSCVKNDPSNHLDDHVNDIQESETDLYKNEENNSRECSELLVLEDDQDDEDELSSIPDPNDILRERLPSNKRKSSPSASIESVSAAVNQFVERLLSKNTTVSRQTLDLALQDCYGRFILNLPYQYLSNYIQLCFAIQEAYWWYDDYWFEQFSPLLPKLSMRNFGFLLIEKCPLLRLYFDSQSYAPFMNHWRRYCQRIPLKGAIILNDTLTKVLMVQGWRGGRWMFPRGKVDEFEDDVSCAVREIREEIGVDVSKVINRNIYVEASIDEQPLKLFIIPGVTETTPFGPRKRKEISRIQWVPLSLLPGWQRYIKKYTTTRHSTMGGTTTLLQTLRHHRHHRHHHLTIKSSKHNPSHTKQKQIVSTSGYVDETTMIETHIPLSSASSLHHRFWNVYPFTEALAGWIYLLLKGRQFRHHHPLQQVLPSNVDLSSEWNHYSESCTASSSIDISYSFPSPPIGYNTLLKERYANLGDDFVEQYLKNTLTTTAATTNRMFPLISSTTATGSSTNFLNNQHRTSLTSLAVCQPAAPKPPPLPPLISDAYWYKIPSTTSYKLLHRLQHPQDKPNRVSLGLTTEPLLHSSHHHPITNKPKSKQSKISSFNLTKEIDNNNIYKDCSPTQATTTTYTAVTPLSARAQPLKNNNIATSLKTRSILQEFQRLGLQVGPSLPSSSSQCENKMEKKAIKEPLSPSTYSQPGTTAPASKKMLLLNKKPDIFPHNVRDQKQQQQEESPQQQHRPQQKGHQQQQQHMNLLENEMKVLQNDNLSEIPNKITPLSKRHFYSSSSSSERLSSSNNSRLLCNDLTSAIKRSLEKTKIEMLQKEQQDCFQQTATLQKEYNANKYQQTEIIERRHLFSKSDDHLFDSNLSPKSLPNFCVSCFSSSSSTQLLDKKNLNALKTPTLFSQKDTTPIGATKTTTTSNFYAEKPIFFINSRRLKRRRTPSELLRRHRLRCSKHLSLVSKPSIHSITSPCSKEEEKEERPTTALLLPDTHYNNNNNNNNTYSNHVLQNIMSKKKNHIGNNNNIDPVAVQEVCKLASIAFYTVNTCRERVGHPKICAYDFANLLGL